MHAHSAQMTATRFDSVWADYGSAFARRSAADAAALNLNESALHLWWVFDVFPRGNRWIVKRRERRFQKPPRG
jgi:hypothetical protein